MATEIGKLDVDRFGTPVSEQAAAKIKADVKIVPAKRSATYAMPLADGAELVGKTLAKTITIAKAGSGSGALTLAKTLADVDAASVLLEALRTELIEQGVTE